MDACDGQCVNRGWFGMETVGSQDLNGDYVAGRH